MSTSSLPGAEAVHWYCHVAFEGECQHSVHFGGFH